MTEELDPTEIRESTLKQLQFAEQYLAGATAEEEVEGLLDENKSFSGVLLDPNDPKVTDKEVAYVTAWIHNLLPGKDINSSPRTQYKSSQITMIIDRIDQQLGQDVSPWFLSIWQEEGSKPIYMLLPENEYALLLTQGYEESPQDQ